MTTQYINVSRWQNKIRTMFGIDGGNPIPTLAELLPVAAVEVDRDEWGYAGQERHGAILTQQPAVAGEFGVIGLVNPLNSGVVTVVRFVENMTAAQVTLKLGRLSEYTANAPTDVAILATDGREWDLSAAAGAGNAPRLATFLRRGSNVALLPLANSWFTHRLLNPLPATGVPHAAADRWYVGLPPGMVLAIEHTAVNAILTLNVGIRERAAESGKGS